MGNNEIREEKLGGWWGSYIKTKAVVGGGGGVIHKDKRGIFIIFPGY
jgi:hypothetical protein